MSKKKFVIIDEEDLDRFLAEGEGTGGEGTGGEGTGGDGDGGEGDGDGDGDDDTVPSIGPSVNIQTEDLQTTARKYRRELLMMPVMSLQSSLEHMRLRPGIRYSETVGELSGDIQFGPYSETREDNDEVVINPRTLYTYFGSVVRNFSPNKIYKSMWGSAITKGEGLKSTEITRIVLQFLAAQLGKNLNKVLWSAVRNDSGDKSVDLFNGFDTIAQAELTASKLSTDLGNLYEFEGAITKNNAVDALKAFCRAADDELLEEPNLKLFVPQHIFYDYCDDYQATVGAIPYNREFKKYFIEGFENIRLVPMANKKDSAFIQLTTQNNMLVGVNQMGEEENIEVARFKAFVLQFIATMFFGVQYETLSKERILFGTIDGSTAI